MLQKGINKIIKEIAREENMKEEDMMTLIKTPFLFVSETMKNANRATLTFPSVRLTGFGIFYCSEGRREFYKKLNERKRECSGTEGEKTD